MKTSTKIPIQRAGEEPVSFIPDPRRAHFESRVFEESSEDTRFWFAGLFTRDMVEVGKSVVASEPAFSRKSFTFRVLLYRWFVLRSDLVSLRR